MTRKKEITPERLLRVRKLMQLTLSTNDHEALGALRKAASILSENKINWDDLFDMIGGNGPAISLAEHQQNMTTAFNAVFGTNVAHMGNATRWNPKTKTAR